MHSAPQSSGRPTARSGRMVGRVTGLWRYPVKSMGAEVLADAEVSWNGLAGDRRWAFIRDGMARSGFPWLTIRQRPEMGRFRPSFVDPDRPDASRTTVLTPSGECFDVADPALAAELAAGARVIKQDRGVFDTSPLSVITTQTVTSLGALAGVELDVLRFRPNLLIEAIRRGGLPRGCVGRLRAAGRRHADAHRSAGQAMCHGQHRSADAEPESGRPAGDRP